MLHLNFQTQMLSLKQASGNLNTFTGISMDTTLESYSIADAITTSNSSQMVKTHMACHSISLATPPKSKTGFIIYLPLWRKVMLITWSTQIILKTFAITTVYYSSDLFTPLIKSKRLQHQWFALISRAGVRSTAHIITPPYIGPLLWGSSFKHILSFVKGMSPSSDRYPAKTHNPLSTLARLHHMNERPLSHGQNTDSKELSLISVRPSD